MTTLKQFFRAAADAIHAAERQEQDPCPPADLDAQTVIEGRQCVCGKVKFDGRAFCRRCLDALPHPLWFALGKPVDRQAWERARDWLEKEVALK